MVSFLFLNRGEKQNNSWTSRMYLSGYIIGLAVGFLLGRGLTYNLVIIIFVLNSRN